MAAAASPWPAGPEQATQLLDLPEDVLLRIGLQLALRERLLLAGVCRKLRRLCAGPSELWRSLRVTLPAEEEGQEGSLQQLVRFRRQAREGWGGVELRWAGCVCEGACMSGKCVCAQITLGSSLQAARISPPRCRRLRRWLRPRLPAVEHLYLYAMGMRIASASLIDELLAGSSAGMAHQPPLPLARLTLIWHGPVDFFPSVLARLPDLRALTFYDTRVRVAGPLLVAEHAGQPLPPLTDFTVDGGNLNCDEQGARAWLPWLPPTVTALKLSECNLRDLPNGLLRGLPRLRRQGGGQVCSAEDSPPVMGSRCGMVGQSVCFFWLSSVANSPPTCALAPLPARWQPEGTPQSADGRPTDIRAAVLHRSGVAEHECLWAAEHSIGGALGSFADRQARLACRM